MLDKDSLITEGKHFGRVFLDYLCAHESFDNRCGGIRNELAEELLNIGLSENLTDKDEINVTNVRNWRDGVHKIPFWVNHAALTLAAEKDFRVSHLADAVAVIATVIKQYTQKKTLSLSGLLIYIEQKYAIVISEDYAALVRVYLESKKYTVLD